MRSNPNYNRVTSELSPAWQFDNQPTKQPRKYRTFQIFRSIAGPGRIGKSGVWQYVEEVIRERKIWINQKAEGTESGWINTNCEQTISAASCWHDCRIEMKLQEFLNFELTYLVELEIMVLVLVDMQGSKTDPDHPVPVPDQLRAGGRINIMSATSIRSTGSTKTSSHLESKNIWGAQDSWGIYDDV